MITNTGSIDPLLKQTLFVPSIITIIIIVAYYGLIFNRNLIIMLISIELMLLAISFLFIYFSILFDDFFNFLFSFYIIAIAAAETAIGLSILISYYRLTGNILIY